MLAAGNFEKEDFVMKQIMLSAFFVFVFGSIAWGQKSADIPEGTQAGQRQVIVVASVAFPFRWCPPGTFTMGSPETEKDRDDSELQHRVTLSRGFWILETEVTQQMYKAVTGTNPSNFKGECLPVDQVSWADANSFCKKLSDILTKTSDAKSSVTFALPTESQWEYAARAASSGPYAGKLNDLAWYGEPTDTGTTHPVATKSPNAWGIHDMHGNLWEWCHDRFADFSKGDVIDPVAPETALGNTRIDRGGCWDSTPEYCRSAYRGVYESDRKSRFVGFRIVAVFQHSTSKDAKH